MELSVKINAAIDGFVSAMKQANNEMQKLVSSTGKPVAVNADTTQAVAGIKNVGEEVNKFAGLYIDKMGKVRDETGRFAAGFSALAGFSAALPAVSAEASATGAFFFFFLNCPNFC